MLQNIISFIRSDWKENKLRCILEVTAWCLSIICSVTMMFTIPHPPFLILYPLFITQCIIFAWAAYTRKSTGMLANYALLATIDLVALGRLISLQLTQNVL